MVRVLDVVVIRSHEGSEWEQTKSTEVHGVHSELTLDVVFSEY